MGKKISGIIGFAILACSACASIGAEKSVVTTPAPKDDRAPASTNIPDALREKTLNKVADELRAGSCPILDNSLVATAQGLVAPSQVIAELYNQKTTYDRRNLSETLMKMVEGSSSTIQELPVNPEDPKYKIAYSALSALGPQRFFALKNSGKELVLRFGPYSNGAIACHSVE